MIKARTALLRFFAMLVAGLLISEAWSEIGKSIPVSIDGVTLGMTIQQVSKCWGKPTSIRVHTNPSAESWIYPEAGVIFQMGSNGKLIAKSVVGRSASIRRTVLINQGDSVEEVEKALVSFGSYRFQTTPGLEAYLASGTLKMQGRELRIDFSRGFVAAVYLVSDDLILFKD